MIRAKVSNHAAGCSSFYCAVTQPGRSPQARGGGWRFESSRCSPKGPGLPCKALAPPSFCKGRIVTVSLAEGWCEGSRVQVPVICGSGNNPNLTLWRHMAWATRPLNALAESGRGVTKRRGCGGNGRRADFRCQWEIPCRFDPCHPHHDFFVS